MRKEEEEEGREDFGEEKRDWGAGKKVPRFYKGV